MPRYGLGVDTGGTFTDAVIVDLSDYKVVAKAKSPTRATFTPFFSGRILPSFFSRTLHCAAAFRAS